MRRLPVLLPLVVVLAGLLVPAAQAGDAIATLPNCPHSYVFYETPGGSPTKFRAGLLCLVNGARKAEGLPALEQFSALERAAQSRATKATKSGLHHVSTSTLDADNGFRASVSGEAAQFLDLEVPTPYNTLVKIVAHHGSPCSTIFDPRVRDIGIGVSTANGPPVRAYAVIEVGLLSGASPAASKTAAAKSCPHAIPKPHVTKRDFIEVVGDPSVAADSVTIRLHCAGRYACVFSASPTLSATSVKGRKQQITINAGATKALRFPFAASAVKAELASQQPLINVDLTVTQPGELSDSVQLGLPTS